LTRAQLRGAMAHRAFGTEWPKAFSGTTVIAGFADAVPWGA
jgi:hypothetical protein